jgi:hypothetical protein
MALTKRFITYKCNVCKRTKDFSADNLHAFINLCTITQNCSGKLSPIATKNIRSILPSEPVNGLLDWIPQNAVILNTVAAVETIFPLDSNSDQIMTIAVLNEGFTALDDTFSLTFTVQRTNIQDFVEYTYTLAANQDTIIGADNSSQSKVLKFISSDNVNVFINGVQTNQFVLQYSDTVGYAIVLNTTRTVSVSVKVVVYPQISITETTSVQFTKNENLTFLKSTAWNNAKSIMLNGLEYVLYSSVLESLPANKELNLYPGNSLTNYSLSNMYFLLSNDPYTSIDRILDFIVPLDILSTPDLWVKYYVDSNKKQIQVSYLALTSIENPIICNLINSEIITTNKLSSSVNIALPKNNSILGAI